MEDPTNQMPGLSLVRHPGYIACLNILETLQTRPVEVEFESGTVVTYVSLERADYVDQDS